MWFWGSVTAEPLRESGAAVRNSDLLSEVCFSTGARRQSVLVAVAGPEVASKF